MRKFIINIIIVLTFSAATYYLSLPLITQHLTDKAAALQAQYQYQQSESLYRQALKLEPANARHYLNLANFYSDANYYQLRPDTIALFVKAGLLNPSWTQPHIDLSNFLIKNSDLTGAEEYIRQAISLDPNNAALRLRLCYFYMQNNEIEQSREQFRRAFIALPAYWSYQLLKDKEISPKYVDIAIEGAEEYLRAHSGDADLYRGLGTLYNRKGESDKAIAYLKEAIRLCNNNAWVHLDLSYAYEKQGDLDRAIKDVGTAVKIAPENYHAIMRLAKLYEKMDMPDEVKSAYKEAINLKPNDEKLRMEFIKYLLSHNETEDAIRESRTAVYKFPMNTNILYQLIQAYKIAGRYQLAMIEMQRLISIEPNSIKHREELSNLYILQVNS